MELISLSAGRLARLATGPVVVPDRMAVFAIEGSQAVACLQGLLTNDVVGPGDDALIYGALLTPKGMIVADAWVFRQRGGFVLAVEPAAQVAVAEGLLRQLPPRLARAADRSADWSVAWILGPVVETRTVVARALASGGEPPSPLPSPGRSMAWSVGGAEVRLACAPAGAPFAWLVVGPTPGVLEVVTALGQSGAAPGDRADLRATRVLAGAPTLGAEIGPRTLPQEVRFDELGGISYVKGCYVGQETVARLHFRGRPNWLLRGLVPVVPAPTPSDHAGVTMEGRPVGRVTTALAVEGMVHLALASIRREVEAGVEVDAPWGRSRVAALPFPLR